VTIKYSRVAPFTCQTVCRRHKRPDHIGLELFDRSRTRMSRIKRTFTDKKEPRVRCSNSLKHVEKTYRGVRRGHRNNQSIVWLGLYFVLEIKSMLICMLPSFLGTQTQPQWKEVDSRRDTAAQRNRSKMFADQFSGTRSSPWCLFGFSWPLNHRGADYENKRVRSSLDSSEAGSICQFDINCHGLTAA